MLKFLFYSDDQPSLLENKLLNTKIESFSNTMLAKNGWVLPTF